MKIKTHYGHDPMAAQQPFSALGIGAGIAVFGFPIGGLAPSPPMQWIAVDDDDAASPRGMGWTEDAATADLKRELGVGR